jgi:hypothetical protein
MDEAVKTDNTVRKNYGSSYHMSSQVINKSRVHINSAVDVTFVVEDNRYSACFERE